MEDRSSALEKLKRAADAAVLGDMYPEAWATGLRELKGSRTLKGLRPLRAFDRLE